MKGHVGSIIERPRKDGGVSYQAMVKIPGAKAAVRTFGDRESAESFLAEVRAEREKSQEAKAYRERWITQMSPGERADLNQQNWANEWLRETLNLYGMCDRVSNRSKHPLNTIKRLAGDVKLGELDKKWVRDFIKRARAVKTRNKTVFKWGSIVCHLRIISAAMNWRAEEMEAKGAKLPFGKNMLPSDWEGKRTRRLSPDEERRMLARFKLNSRQSGPHWTRMFKLALHTGARLQELVLAEWSEFDLDRRYWIIPEHHTKTGKERMVPLSKAAVRALRVMRLIASPASQRVFHEIKSSASASSVFSKITRCMGIVDLRFHDLRHEAISRMVLKQRQLSVFEIMGIVGHSSLEMLKRYTNLRGDELAAKLID
jgi:integrase